MNEFRKITGIVEHGWYRLIENKKCIHHHYHLILDNKQVLELFRKEEVNIRFGDEMEFFVRNCGNYLEVINFKVLRKYISPPLPIDPQKKLNDFENAVKKQDGKKDG